MEETVILSVKGRQFTVRKEFLCRHSVYFQGMFSENFKEHNQQEITLDSIDPTTMELILDYMYGKFLPFIDYQDLSDDSLAVVGNLAVAADMLQIKHLSKVVESTLEHLNITPTNCFEIMAIASNVNYTKLLQKCTRFALTSFYDMKPELVPSVHDLVWYLSHNHLYVRHETDVFNFGLNWMSKSKALVEPSDLLLVLGCLDIRRVTTQKLLMIKIQLMDFKDTLVSQVVDFLIELSEKGDISNDQVIARKNILKEKNMENVYDEVSDLVKDSKSRKYEYTLVFATNNLSNAHSILERSRTGQILLDTSKQYLLVLYKLTNAGIEVLLKSTIPPDMLDCSSISYYSWNIAAWGSYKLVLVISQTDYIKQKTIIRVYDVLKEEWMDYDTLQTEGMCCRLAVIDGTMTIICSNGSNIVYEFSTKTYRAIAKLPFMPDNNVTALPPDHIPVPILPLTCVHNNQIYVSDHKAVYKYEEARSEWTKVMEYRDVTGMMAHMVSHDGYIFVTDALQRTVYKFKPEEDETVTIAMKLPNEIIAVDSIWSIIEQRSVMNCCDLGNKLIFLTSRPYYTEKSLSRFDYFSVSRNLYVEKYNDQAGDGENQLEELLCLENMRLEIDPIIDSCSLAMIPPPGVDTNISEYLQKCLSRYQCTKREIE